MLPANDAPKSEERSNAPSSDGAQPAAPSVNLPSRGDLQPDQRQAPREDPAPPLSRPPSPAAPATSAALPPVDRSASSPAPTGVFQPPPQPGVGAPKKKNSHSKPTPAGHVPRPRNPFILYRMDVVSRNLIRNENKHQNISKIVSAMWKELSDAEKEPYQAAAKLEKDEHKRLYPNYVYQPANLAPKPAKAKLTVKKTSSPKASKAAAVARSRKKKARSDESDSDVSEDSDDQGGSDDEYMACGSRPNKKRSRAFDPSGSSRTVKPRGSESSSAADSSFSSFDSVSSVEDTLERAFSASAAPHSSDGRGPLPRLNYGPAPGEAPPSFLPPSHPQDSWSLEEEEALLKRMRLDQGIEVRLPSGRPSGQTSSDYSGERFGSADEPLPSPHTQLSYTTYPSYDMPTELAYQHSMPYGRRRFHTSSDRPVLASHLPAAEFLPTSALSPVTPAFPHANAFGGRRRGSSIGSSSFAASGLRTSFHEGASDSELFTPRTRDFLLGSTSGMRDALDTTPSAVSSSDSRRRTHSDRPAYSHPSGEPLDAGSSAMDRSSGSSASGSWGGASSSSSYDERPSRWHMDGQPLFIPPPPAHLRYPDEPLFYRSLHPDPQQHHSYQQPTYYQHPPSINLTPNLDPPSSSASSGRRKGRPAPLALHSNINDPSLSHTSYDPNTPRTWSGGSTDSALAPSYSSTVDTPRQAEFQTRYTTAAAEDDEEWRPRPGWVPFDEAPPWVDWEMIGSKEEPRDGY